MTINLDAIILYVHDVDLLKSFYRDMFHMQVLEEDPSVWVLLEAGNGKLGLHKAGEQYRNEGKGGAGCESNCKIVFDISEDIGEARTRLLERNVEMREIKTFEHYDYWLCDGADPEGNIFQLKKRK